jgi:hypothetical protein
VGTINTRPVTPGDLAATIYRHFGVPLDAPSITITAVVGGQFWITANRYENCLTFRRNAALKIR